MKLRDISDSSFQMELIPYPIFRVLCERKLKWICGQWYTVFGCIRAGKWRAREKVKNDSLFFSLCREFYFSYRILEFLNHKVVDDIIKILCERKKKNVQLILSYYSFYHFFRKCGMVSRNFHFSIQKIKYWIRLNTEFFPVQKIFFLLEKDGKKFGQCCQGKQNFYCMYMLTFIILYV